MNKRKLAYLLITPILLSSCGALKTNKKLQLIAFEGEGVSEKTTAKKFAKQEAEESRDFRVTDEDSCSFIATVRNTDRLSFVDLVLYSEAFGTSVVFNEGNGDYVCKTNTVLKGDEWVTTISFDLDYDTFVDFDIKSCKDPDTKKLEIKEITFISTNGKNVAADLRKKSDIRIINLIPDNPFFVQHDFDENQHCNKCDFSGPGHYLGFVESDGYYKVNAVYPDRLGYLDTMVVPGVYKDKQVKEVLPDLMSSGQVAILNMIYQAKTLKFTEGIEIINQHAIDFDSRRDKNDACEIYLPHSLKKMGHYGYGFAGWDATKETLFYNGTYAEWQNIEIVSYGGSTIWQIYKLVCTDGTYYNLELH